MPFPLIPAGTKAGGYTIAKSLRFRSSASAYLSRTFTTPTNNKIFTWSGWVKIGTIPSAREGLFVAGNAGGTLYFGLEFNASAQLNLYDTNVGGATVAFTTTQVFRDPSSWYHIVLAVDTTQATASNRNKLYVNGVQVTAFSTAVYSPLNSSPYMNSAVSHSIGAWQPTSSILNFDGYLSEVNFIDCPALVGSTTNSSTTVTLSAGSTASIQVGWNISGTNIPVGATVSSITNSTTFELSVAATGAGTSIAFSATPPISAFGQTDTATGVWMPKAYTGSYGTNGFYLKFADASAATAAAIGKDSSGNGNNWTPNNIVVTSGTTCDTMVDTPTNYDNGGNGAGNYCVLNPLDAYASAFVYADGNLKITFNSGTWRTAFATMRVSTGKWYWESVFASVTGAGGYLVGVGNDTLTTSSNPNTSNAYFYEGIAGAVVSNGTTLATVATSTTTDVIGLALDADAKTLAIYKNNTLLYTITSLPSGTSFAPIFSDSATGSSFTIVNFGQRPFTYTPPTGFKALCTQNLPTPTIGATSSTLANKYFDVALWSGDSTTPKAVVTTLNFQPDFVWGKSRSTTYDHQLFDAVRGAGSTKDLATDTTGAEGASGALYGYVSSFDSAGFTVTKGSGATNIWNQSGQTFVSWNWKANGSGSSNTSGSITSTVSANVTAGFSVVTYTGTGSTGTVGHGLGVAPKMIIMKDRGAVGAWPVFHASLANMTSAYLALNTTSAVGTLGSAVSAPTSTTFGISSSTSSATTCVAYCFSEVAGYSKFGSYTGNGSADGPMIWTGMRSRYIMIKRSDSTGNWVVYDTARNTYNAVTLDLDPNLSNAEAATGTNGLDILSNGFKIRDTSLFWNASGGTYIYAAFAESPFNYARAR